MDDEPEVTQALLQLARVLAERGVKLVEVRATGVRPSRTVETSAGPVTVNYVDRYVPLLTDEEIDYMRQWTSR